MTDDPWWVAISNTNCERRATQGLADRGFEVWRPSQWLEIRVGKGRWPACRQIYPAPGYLFTRHPNRNAWTSMFGIDGVCGVRFVDNTPQTESAAEIKRWQRWLVKPDFPVIEDAFTIGQQIRITTGPFAQFNGLIERLERTGTVKVGVGMFGRRTLIELDREQVEAL